MDVDIDPRLKGIEPKIIELVTNEIMDHGPPVNWDDIAGRCVCVCGSCGAYNCRDLMHQVSRFISSVCALRAAHIVG